MTRPRWLTPEGRLAKKGIALDYYNQVLEVSTDTDKRTPDPRVTFSFLSGELPPGIQVIRSGILQGIPIILDPLTTDESRDYRFTIRATAHDGVVVDRSFIITVTNVFPPIIVPKIKDLGQILDGTFYSKQLQAVEENPGVQLKWSLLDGKLPNGVALSESGLISGYVMPEPDEYEDILPGYDAYNPNSRKAYDQYPYDSLGRSRNRGYTFTVQVSDGTNIDTFAYNLFVVAKSLLTADQDFWIDRSRYRDDWDPLETYYVGQIVIADDYLYYEASINIDGKADNLPPYEDNTAWKVYEKQKVAVTVDNTAITVDTDNFYAPIISTPAQELPVVRQENNFAFKFDVVDFEPGQGEIRWSFVPVSGSAYDLGSTREWGNDSSVTMYTTTAQIFETDGTETAFVLNESEYDPALTYNIIEVFVNDTLADPSLYEVSTNDTQVSFYAPPDAGKVRVRFTITAPTEGRTGAPFDSTVFDQSTSELPPVLEVDDHGWLHGYLEPQAEDIKTYEFQIIAYKVLGEVTYQSKPVRYSLTVLGNLSDRIIWTSPTMLGSIDNGAISEFQINAVSELGQSVRYSLAPNRRTKIPQALSLKLLDTGYLVGRTSFHHFQLDGGDTTLDRAKTNIDTLYEFDIKAETTNIRKLRSPVVISKNNPGQTYLELAYSGDIDMVGKEISGVNIPNKTIVVEQYKMTSDTGTYTKVYLSKMITESIDDTEYIYVMDGIVSSTKTFQIKIVPTHKEPYENLYFKAFPTLEQRQRFADIINDQDLFPDELIYRLGDPWFGKAENIKFLALAGVRASSISDYVDAIERNHYWKQVNFGEIKTAVAVDEYYNTRYEVVYLEIVDPTNLNDVAVTERIDLSGQPYIDENGVEHNTIYPSTFENMRQNVRSNLGYYVKGVLPEWMTSVQPDKTVLGFRRAVVLAYTKPGAAKLIAYRLKSRGISFNDIEFTIDRYQLDNSLTKYFDLTTRQYITSKETTFDRLLIGAGDVDGGTVDYAVQQPFDSINNRTVSYIKARGGIDGVRNFADGDLLVFAQQEDFGTQSPHDGWIRYNNLYVGDLPGDGRNLGGLANPYEDSDDIDSVYGFDAFTVVPSIRNKALTVSNYLTRRESSSGSYTIEIPYVLGASFVGKNISGTGIPIGTKILEQEIEDVGGDGTDLAWKFTLDKSLTSDIPASSAITVKSSITTATRGYNNQVELENVPSDLLGSVITGDNVPENTIVTSIVGNVIFTNNSLSKVTSGSLFGYEVTNQRGGIWRVKIDEENIVSLEFVKEVKLGQKIKVLGGMSNGYTFMVYDSNIDAGKIYPAYRRWTEQTLTLSDSTVFDGNGTRFFTNRDVYSEPEKDDKYIKFPQIGVFV